MGKDNQPKARQARQLARKKAQRAGYDRILIVSEGTKTEPLYFEEIRSYFHLHTANVQVQPSDWGTQPAQVVKFTEHLLLNGDKEKGIQPKAFETAYAVFDRDQHATYHDALAIAASLDGRVRNDLGERIKFKAIPSVPCFELWLLLHFADVLAPIHRNEAFDRLRQHLHEYEKGQQGHFLQTREHFDAATRRAEHLASLTTAHNGEEPYTDVHELVTLLTALKSD